MLKHCEHCDGIKPDVKSGEKLLTSVRQSFVERSDEEKTRSQRKHPSDLPREYQSRIESLEDYFYRRLFPDLSLSFHGRLIRRREEIVYWTSTPFIT